MLTTLLVKFLGKPATLINANSYPAAKLTFNYHIFIQSINSENVTDGDFSLDAQVSEKIKQDILKLLNNYDGQIIVYIQALLRFTYTNIYIFRGF